jgi:hypothetical protein
MGKIEAEDFLKAEVSQWANLWSLTLGSRRLSKKEPPEMIDVVLRSAALAATRMPKLRVMTISNTDDLGGMVFRYKVKDRTAEASVCCS